MFDLGWPELLLIGIVALIVMGDDFPTMFRTPRPVHRQDAEDGARVLAGHGGGCRRIRSEGRQQQPERPRRRRSPWGSTR